MNKRQLSVLIKYCKFVFGTTDVPVDKCIAVAELEAEYYGITIADFFDDVADFFDDVANGKIKLW